LIAIVLKGIKRHTVHSAVTFLRFRQKTVLLTVCDRLSPSFPDLVMSFIDLQSDRLSGYPVVKVCRLNSRYDIILTLNLEVADSHFSP